MNFSEMLASNDPRIIKKALFFKLDQLTPQDVRALDSEYQMLKDKEQKHMFFARFESSKHTTPARDPKLLQRWIHFIWIRLQLVDLINQKASLNHIMEIKRTTRQHILAPLPILVDEEGEPIPNPIIPTLNSISRAIQEHKEHGASIEGSIEIIRRMNLQVIGTEHPTDPLSQHAKETLRKIANAFDAEVPNEDEMDKLLRALINSDAMPYAKRTVPDEVRRNIHTTINPLYDSTPSFIKEILAAYRLHYGEKLFLLHKNAIFEAIEGGKEIDGIITTPLLKDGGWAGGDADGNKNVTATATHESISISRQNIVEKHIETLNTLVIKMVEHQQQDQPILDFRADIQLFLQILKNYKEQVQLNSHDIYIEIEALTAAPTNESPRRRPRGPWIPAFAGNSTVVVGTAVEAEIDDVKIPATTYIVNQFTQLLKTHQGLLNKYPELEEELRCFGIQLRCYGMTGGVMHVRQDASVFTTIWDSLCAALVLDERLSSYEVLQPLKDRHYNTLTNEERIAFHQRLQDGSIESGHVLNAIHHLHSHADCGTNYPSVKMELDRIQLAKEHADMIENFIISNCKSAADILGVNSLFSVFPERPHQVTPAIIPLLETRADLVNYERIVIEMIRSRIQHRFESLYDTTSLLQTTFQSKDNIKKQLDLQNPEEFRALIKQLPDELRAYLKDINIEIMLGFSDTQRVSGFGVTLTIKEVQERFKALAEDCGVQSKIFFGPGGEIPREGMKPRYEKATLQGKTHDVLITPRSAQWYRETQFYQVYREKSNLVEPMEITSLPEEMREALNEMLDASAECYELLHDTENGLGKLLGSELGITGWIVPMLNPSSRDTARGRADKSTDRTASVQSGGERPTSHIKVENLRAISAMYMQQMLRENLNFIGPSFGMRKIGLERSVWLYDHSKTFRSMVAKETIGTVMRDLSFCAHALFADHPELSPLNIGHEQRKKWADECITTYPERLKTMDLTKPCAESEKYERLVMLSKLFAYIQIECEETETFLAKMNEFIHPEHGKKRPTLLAHHPMCDMQLQELTSLADPLFYLLARHCHQVAKGANLDEVHNGINSDEVLAEGELSGIAKLLGDYGTGIMAYLTSPPGYSEQLYWSDNDNYQPPSLDRAQNEATMIGRPLAALANKATKVRFFDVTAKQLEQLDAMIANKLRMFEQAKEAEELAEFEAAEALTLNM